MGVLAQPEICKKIIAAAPGKSYDASQPPLLTKEFISMAPNKRYQLK
jgi:hypothetical protein